MAARRAAFADLPHYFDAANYDSCAQWNLGTWAANINLRLKFNAQLDDDLRRDSKDSDLRQQATRMAIEALLKMPERRDAVEEEGAMDEFPDSPPALAKRVRGLSALDILRSQSVFTSRWFSKYNALYELAATAIDPVTGIRGLATTDEAEDAAEALATTPEWKMMRGALGSDYEFGPFALATVDLEAPDEDLIDDFKKWLGQERQNRGIREVSRSFDRADLALWGQMRVLAYIDLTIWAKANGMKIGAALMGRAVFPDEFNIGLEDRIRKVVAREAQRLLDPRTLRAMQSQYLKTERETGKSIPE